MKNCLSIIPYFYWLIPVPMLRWKVLQYWITIHLTQNTRFFFLIMKKCFCMDYNNFTNSTLFGTMISGVHPLLLTSGRDLPYSFRTKFLKELYSVFKYLLFHVFFSYWSSFLQTRLYKITHCILWLWIKVVTDKI